MDAAFFTQLATQTLVARQPVNRLTLHFMASAISSKRFVEPVVSALLREGFAAELCTEHAPGEDRFLAALECPVNILRFNLVANPFAVFWRLVICCRYLMLRRPHIVHAHQSRGSFVPLLAAFLVRVPIRIYHNHGSAFWGTKGPLKAAFWVLERLNCAFANHVVFVNEDLRDEFQRYGILNGSKYRSVGPGSACGVDLNDFPLEQFMGARRAAQRKGLHLPPDAFVVLFVGRPYRRKGFHFLLRNWARSFNQEGNRLLLAGCSKADLNRVLSRAPSTIIPMGFVLDMRSAYAAADVIVLPSEHEGFPYALLEGAAAQRCLLGTDARGLKSVLLNDATGLTFQVGDSQGFVRNLARLKEDRALRDRLAQGARARAEQFTRPVVIAGLIHFYQWLTDPKAAG